MNELFIYDEDVYDEVFVNQIGRDGYRCPYFINNKLISPIISGENVIGDGLCNYLVSGRNDAKTINHIEEIGKYIIGKLANKYNLNITKVLDIRSNIFFSSLNLLETGPHIKSTDKHYLLIYYVDDYDNQTVIYNEKFNFGNKYKLSNLTIDKIINPKRGSVVLFNGLRYHSILLPKNNDYRCMIFIRLEIEWL